MRNIKLVIEYDGTDFLGWQWQPEGRTVQRELQSALKQLLQDTPKVYAAGRTDSGVHALGQVVNFKTGQRLDLHAIQAGLNSYLPSDVRVLSAVKVDERFHARFSAVGRVYRYVISKRQRAVARQYSWFCKYELDVSLMKEASQFLLGTHNFQAFSKRNEEESHYLSRVERLHWEDAGDELVMEIEANRFLHNMVRIIVGNMVDVGRGRLSPVKLREILENGERMHAAVKTPPHGLSLVKVNY